MCHGREPWSSGYGKRLTFQGSRHRILDGHFFKYICCKNCNVCLKRPKIEEKEAGVGPFFNVCAIEAPHKAHSCDTPWSSLVKGVEGSYRPKLLHL